MVGLIITILFILVLLTGLYCLYRYVFCFPAKKRPDARCIPESNLYNDHREKMLECIRDMENTPYEEVNVQSFDGYRLYGKLYNIKKGAPVMIFFHGYHGTSSWDGYGFFKICKNNGINILMADERAHGKSEGKAITFGVRERYDCKSWTEYAVDRFGKDTDIFLAGVSMGAATVMMAAELGLPENVRAIVADCGYSEPSAIIKENVRRMKIPVKPVYFLINLGAHIFGHFNLQETTALRAVRKTDIPILFIHGKQDSVVPMYMAEELYENCAGTKGRVVIEGADHANSAMADYSSYEKAVMEFLIMRKK